MTKTRIEQAAQTRSKLIAVARRLFAAKGFHATGTHEIVRAGHISRGALYHHFASKEDLFLAVFHEVRRDWIREATAGDHPGSNRWERLREHIKLFVRAAVMPDVHRIVMIDGPAVLGWKTWRDVQAADGIVTVGDAVAEGIAAGLIRPQPREALAYLIIALIEEGALVVTHADDQAAAIESVEVAVDTLLDNMR